MIPRLSLNLLWLLTIPLASARPAPAQSPSAEPWAGQRLALSVNPTVPQTDAHAEATVLASPARLVVDDMALEPALRQLAAASGVQLDFSPSALPAHSHVRCDCVHATVGEALSRLLAGTGLRYSALGQHVLITHTGRDAASQEQQEHQDRTLTGHVLENETGQPLGSASVIIKGTTLGTHTKPDGTFSLPVPDTAFTLQVRLIGYLVAEARIDRSQGTADFHLVA